MLITVFSAKGGYMLKAGLQVTTKSVYAHGFKISDYCFSHSKYLAD